MLYYLQIYLIKKSLEFYKKTDKIFSKLDVIKSDVKINTSKKWIHSYWNSKRNPVVKLVEDPNLGKEANSANVLKIDLANFIIDNINGDILFIKLLQNKDILSNLSKNNLCKILEIVFRLKNKMSKDQIYFISFDLLYYKLK